MPSKLDVGTLVRLSEALAQHPAERTETVVVGPLSLDIGRGEIMSVIGPSAQEKSLLLRMIAGLEPLRSGAIEFIGEEDQATKTMGFVFQDSVLFPWRNVLRNVSIEAEIQHLDPESIEQRARRLLAAMSLTGYEDRRPQDLRFEEAQRVAMCRALLNSPSLLLLDDPFGRMDFAAREHFVSDFQRFWMESRFAVVLATGDVSEAVQLSDRVVLMSQGPCQILEILEIDLPRPRRLDKATTPRIADYGSHIRTIFRAQGFPY